MDYRSTCPPQGARLRGAFTLIELLVVIAIIAVLAAILFPVFAQAKVAAKKTQALSNTKQLATAVVLYTTDSDDTFPMAFSRRNDGSWRYDTVHPAPTGVVTSDNWNGAVNEQVKCQWANSIQPYVKNSDIYLQPSQNPVGIEGDVFDPAIKPWQMGMTFNGLLHTLSATTIEQPSVVVTMWPGTGNSALIGRSIANPSLKCDGTVGEPCQFNPSGAPMPGETSGTDYSLFFGFSYYDPENTLWLYNRGVVMARADTSAKYQRVGTYIGDARGVPGADPFKDPIAVVSSSVQPLGVGWTYDFCSSGDTVATSRTQPRYVCFFRPDRTR